MRNIILAEVVFCVMSLFVSCLKSNNNQKAAPVFTWKIDNGIEQISDTTSYVSLLGYHYIRGKKSTVGLFIVTSSISTGSYSMSNANAGFGLTINGTQYTPISGSITIFSNSNRILKGAYNSILILSNIDTVSITGTFDNIGF